MPATKVLVAVLNWGLGHAARSVPVIKELLRQNCEVIVGSDGAALNLLRFEFPQLRFVALPAYGVSYAATAGGMVWSLARQMPRLVRIVKQELKLVTTLVENEKINLIISDNRYGAYHAAVYSVWLGHQLQLPVPQGWSWLSPAINRLHIRYLKHFNDYWVPDLPGAPLSGQLSASVLPVQYIGPLSRFDGPLVPPQQLYRVVAVLSGPEPQRTLLEKALRLQLSSLPVRSLLVRGVGIDQRIRQGQYFDEADFMPGSCLGPLLYHADFIVSRSGYSTVMDLSYLNKPALCIPTPGQPEQEYLARRLAAGGHVFIQLQHNINLTTAWSKRHTLNPWNYEHNPVLLSHAVSAALQRVR